MVKFSRRKKVFYKKTKKYRGGVLSNVKGASPAGGPPSFLAGLGAAMLKKTKASSNANAVPIPVGGPPTTGLGAASIPAGGPSSNNASLVKYRKMLSMGQPKEAVIQKMLTNGKNPKNIFSEYTTSAGAPAPVKPLNFTLDEFRDLKDYVVRSEIVVRMKQLGLDPTEIYPEITEADINLIIEEYSKPRVVKIVNAPPVSSAAPVLSMKNALSAAIKDRVKVNSVKQDISYFTEYSDKEQADLNILDASKLRIKVIETTELVAAKKSIKTAEEKGQRIKDFQLKAILALLKEKRDLETLISKLNTDKLKKKVRFVRGEDKIIKLSEDRTGPLPNGWKVVIDSEKGTLYYEDKYLNTTTNTRPIEPSLRPELLPEGWIMNEDDNDAWYVNIFNGSSQWEIPTESASIGYEVIINNDGSKIWYKKVEGGDDTWFEMHNSSGKKWYENPSVHGDGVKFNTPE